MKTINILANIRSFLRKIQNSVGRTPVFGRSSAGKSVTPTTAIQLTVVYACIRIIAETVASLPLNVFKMTDKGKEKDYTHPLYSILHDAPNEEMTSFVFRETLTNHLMTYGNAYAQIIRNGLGQIISLHLLLPDKISVERDQTTGKLYYIYTDEEKKQTTVLKKSEVLHIPGLSFDGLVGYSPIEMAKNAIGLSMAAEEYGSKFFANGGNPSGVIEHPKTLNGESSAKKLRDNWSAIYGGSSNSNKTAVLEEGMTYKPISIPPEQAQFLETRKFQVTEICRIFRIPPHMVADLEKSSFSNIEQQSLEFITNTMTPWLVRFEQAFTLALLTKDERSTHLIKFNVNAMLRGDTASRAALYNTMRQNGIQNANDIRELEDMNLLPEEVGGNAYLVNGNMISLKKAMES